MQYMQTLYYVYIVFYLFYSRAECRKNNPEIVTSAHWIHMVTHPISVLPPRLNSPNSYSPCRDTTLESFKSKLLTLLVQVDNEKHVIGTLIQGGGGGNGFRRAASESC